MDIASISKELEQDEIVVDVKIKRKNGRYYTDRDGNPCTIGVTGSDAKAYREEKMNQQREMLTTRKTDLEPEDIARQRVNQAAAGCARWSGWDDGVDSIPFSRKAVAGLLSVDHILFQVERAIDGHHSFFESAPTT